MSYSRLIACLGRVAIPITVIVASGLAYIGLTTVPEESTDREAAPRKIRTTVTRLAVEDYRVTVRTNAIVQPRNRVTISSEVAGRVVKIHPNFEAGSYFSQGDVLLELDEDDVTQQEINYEQALAIKISAESEVSIAETSMTEYLEGNYKQEKAVVEKSIFDARQALRTAQLKYESSQRLAARGMLKSLQLESVKYAVDAVQKELELREIELEVYENFTKDKRLHELRGALGAAQARLAAAEAACKLEKQKLEREQLRAPFDGRVLVKAVGLGQQVTAATVLGEVISIDYAVVRLPLARRDLRFLELPEMNGDEPVDVILRDAIDDSSEHVWNAKIVRTEGMLDPDSLELFAIAVIEDPFGLHSDHPVLRMGQPVLATIKGDVLSDVIKLPRHAVSELNQVFLVDEEQLTLSQRTIQSLWSDDEYIIISDPAIRDGDLIATTNLVYAPAGSAVEIIPEVESDDPSAANGTSEVAQR